MSRRKTKDKNAPKRPLSAYFIFMSERRAIVRQKYSNESNKLSMTDITKLLAKEWRNLSLTARSKYLKKAEKLKEDYKIKLAEYKQSNCKNFANKINQKKRQTQNRSTKNLKKPLRKRSINAFFDSDTQSETNAFNKGSVINTNNSKKPVEQSKQNVMKTLKTMGFAENYIGKAVKKYEANHNGPYNIQNITDIIIDMQTIDKTVKSSVNNTYHNSNSNDVMECKEENKRLKYETNGLKKRLEIFECTREQINRMNLDELNELKSRIQHTMQHKIQLIEEAQKKIMDNTYKCVACMDNLKNISFDGCSHIALCDTCEVSMESKRCPICQTPYKNAKKINF